ncbi:hypothetical protein [Caloramator sp. ALD01]|uniref:hypothetical protein n=1 Tax=Caloramator sp. ALD01 TaxID=1031288 RepID=UPI0003FF598E|nr:hypothetical protein [Caloramator sp. ALD01]
MSYQTANLKRDANGIVVPQYYNPGTEQYEVLIGNNGAINANVNIGTVTAISVETITSTPVTGVKTVTSTAAEIFAGASAKANRRKMVIKNEDAVLRVRIGSSSVTQQNGFPVEPGAIVELQFDPSIYVPIYAISEGAQVQISVFEY